MASAPRRHGRRRARRTVAPWSIFASSREDSFVPVSTGGASNLYVGTYVPGDGTMFGLKREWADRVRAHYPHLRDEPTWRLPQLRVMDTVAATHPEAPDREAALRAAARDNVREYVVGDPLGFGAMAVRKVSRLWLSYSVGTVRHQRDAMRALHVALVLAAFAGLAAGLVARRGRVTGPVGDRRRAGAGSRWSTSSSSARRATTCRSCRCSWPAARPARRSPSVSGARAR